MIIVKWIMITPWIPLSNELLSHLLFRFKLLDLVDPVDNLLLESSEVVDLLDGGEFVGLDLVQS